MVVKVFHALEHGDCFCHPTWQTVRHISDLSISPGPTVCEEEENQSVLSLMTSSLASVGFFLKTELS
jgi:hypothetical protein